MKISDLKLIESLDCLQDEFEDADIAAGYTSDLLSDVMANAEEGAVLVTIQAHKNTVAVCSLAGVGAIVVCNRRPVPDDMLEAAAREGIAVFTTADNQFRTSAMLSQHLAGCPAR